MKKRPTDFKQLIIDLFSGKVSDSVDTAILVIPKTTIIISIPKIHACQKVNPINYEKIIYILQKKYRAENIQILLLDHHHKKLKTLERKLIEENGAIISGLSGVVSLDHGTNNIKPTHGTEGNDDLAHAAFLSDSSTEDDEFYTEEDKNEFITQLQEYSQVYEIQLNSTDLKHVTTEEEILLQISQEIIQLITKNHFFEKQNEFLSILSRELFDEILLHYKLYDATNLEFPSIYENVLSYILEMLFLRKWTKLDQRFLATDFYDSLLTPVLHSTSHHHLLGGGTPQHRRRNSNSPSRGPSRAPSSANLSGMMSIPTSYQNTNNNIHLVIHGSTGSGKTSFLSKLIATLHSEQSNIHYGKKIPIIIRSCGKFQKSKHAYHLIQNILIQLLFLYGVESTTIQELLLFKTFYTSNYFDWNIVNSILIEYPMFLILDDIDLLYFHIDDSYEKLIQFLFKEAKLHPSTRIILSYNKNRIIPIERDPRGEGLLLAQQRRNSSFSILTTPDKNNNNRGGITSSSAASSQQHEIALVEGRSPEEMEHDQNILNESPSSSTKNIRLSSAPRKYSTVRNNGQQQQSTTAPMNHDPTRIYHHNVHSRVIEFLTEYFHEYSIPQIDLDLVFNFVKPEEKMTIFKSIDSNQISNDQLEILENMIPSILPESSCYLYGKLAIEYLKLFKNDHFPTLLSTTEHLKNPHRKVTTAFHDALIHAGISIDPSTVVLEPYIEGLLTQFITFLEIKYGKELISYCFAFITFAREGLTDIELQDLLSLKDSVLHEIMNHFQFNTMTCNHLRFPLSIWLLIKNTILFLFTPIHGRNIYPNLFTWSSSWIQQFMELKYFYLLKDVSKIMANYFCNHLSKLSKHEKYLLEQTISLNSIPIWFPSTNINSRRIHESYYHFYYASTNNYLIGAIKEMISFEILCGISLLADGSFYLYYFNLLVDLILPPGSLNSGNHPPRHEGDRFYFLKDTLQQYSYWINKEILHFYQQPQEAIIYKASNEFTLPIVRENVLQYLRDIFNSYYPASDFSVSTHGNNQEDSRVPSKSAGTTTDHKAGGGGGNEEDSINLRELGNNVSNLFQNFVHEFTDTFTNNNKDSTADEDHRNKVPGNNVVYIPPHYQFSNNWENSNSWTHKIILFNKNRFHGMISNLLGHSYEITCVVWNPTNNRQLASSSNDKTIKVWDIYSEQILYNLIGHTSSINSIHWSYRTNLLVSGSSDNTIKIWDMNQYGKEVMTLYGHSDWVLCVAWNHYDNQIASGSQDKTIKIWNYDSGELIFTLVGHKRVLCLTWSNDNSKLASGSDDKSIKIWDMMNGRALFSIDAHNEPVTCIAWGNGTKDCNLLASGSEDFSIKIWDTNNGKLLKLFKGKTETFFDRWINGHTFYISGIVWNHNNTKIASSSLDQTVKIWDVENNSVLGTLNGHKSVIRSLAWSKNDQYLATASDDLSIKIWNIEQELKHNENHFYGHTDLITTLALSPDGNLVVTGSDDKTIIIWDVILGKPLSILAGHSTPVEYIEWVADGSMIVSSTRHSIKIWDVVKGKVLKNLKRRVEHTITFGLSSLENTMLASGIEMNQIKIWDVHSGRSITTLPGNVSGSSSSSSSNSSSNNGHKDEVTCISWNYNNKKLVSGSIDMTLKIWDLNKENVQFTLEGHKSSIRAVKWNNNQKHSQIISSSRDNTVKLWDADNGSMIYSLSLPGVTMLHWNNDINTKFLISSPSSIGIIDMETGTCVRSFYFEKDEFSNSCVVWNQEGNKIVAAKNDAIIIYQLIVPVIPSSSSTAAVATSDSHPSALPPGIVNPITLPMHPQVRSMSPSTQQILKSPSLSGKLHPPPPPTLPLDEY